MTSKEVKDKVKRYLTRSEVVYMTSDGLGFFEKSYADSHAQKKGLQVKEYKRPKKKVKNGTK